MAKAAQAAAPQPVASGVAGGLIVDGLGVPGKQVFTGGSMARPPHGAFQACGQGEWQGTLVLDRDLGVVHTEGPAALADLTSCVLAPRPALPWR